MTVPIVAAMTARRTLAGFPATSSNPLMACAVCMTLPLHLCCVVVLSRANGSIHGPHRRHFEFFRPGLQRAKDLGVDRNAALRAKRAASGARTARRAAFRS